MASTYLGPAGERIRVLRMFSRLNVGGPSLHVVLLTAGLGERGYETRLVVGQESPGEGNLLDWARERGVACEQLAVLGREIRPLRDARALLAVYRLVRQFRPHVVHTHTAKAGLIGRLAARWAGVPVIVHTFHGHVLRGYFGPLRNALFRGLERSLARRSSALVAVSEAVKADLVELRVAPAERIRVVPLGLELQPLAGSLPRGALRSVLGITADAPLVGVVGRLAPIKDLGTFLDAAAQVRARRPEVLFVLVGDGEQRAALESRATALGLAEAVRFAGWQRDLRQVYGDLDLVVNCSRNEGTPVALIEALAAARPVVATRVGGTSDLLAGGRHGWLVVPGDAGALAAGMLAALDQPHEARSRARAGQVHVLRQHALARLLDDVDQLYRELLAAPGSTAA